MKDMMINPNGAVDAPADLQPLLDIDLEATHLTSTPEGMRLVGSVCRDCHEVVFPVRQICFYCGSRNMADALMPSEGTLYSFSVVHISSTRPVPYTIGYVDLDNGVRLLAPIEGNIEEITPDCRVRLEVRDQTFRFVAMERE